MFHRIAATALAAALAVLPAQTWAQPAPAQGQPATPSFRSALEGYQPFTAQEVAPWRASNDEVGRIGGWRAYAREAQEGAAPRDDAPAGAPAAPAAVPAAVPAAPAPGHRHH